MLTDFQVALVAPNLCTSVQSVGVFVGGYGILPYPRHLLPILPQNSQNSRKLLAEDFLPRISQMLTEVYGVGFSHGFHRIHRNDCRRIFSHGFHRFSQIFRLRFCLLICAHPCLSVEDTSLPECSVCSAYSVGTLSLFALLVLQRQLHQRGSILPRNSRNPRNVRLRYWRRGYGRDAIPS